MLHKTLLQPIKQQISRNFNPELCLVSTPDISPTQVLIKPNPVSVPRSDKIRRVQGGMTVDHMWCLF